MSRVDWILARASGMSAFVLLSAAMVLGLMLALRHRSGRWPRFVTNDLHRFVTGLALWMTGFHLLMLVVNDHAGIGPVDLVVPFTTASSPVANGLGVLAVWALVAVGVSTAYRGRMSPSTWKGIHRAAYGAYAAALGHGIFAGTDTGEAWAWPVYLASALAVGWLTWRRITGRPFDASAPGRTPRHTPRSSPAPPASRHLPSAGSARAMPAAGSGNTVAPADRGGLPPLPLRNGGPRGPIRL